MRAAREKLVITSDCLRSRMSRKYSDDGDGLQFSYLHIFAALASLCPMNGSRVTVKIPHKRNTWRCRQTPENENGAPIYDSIGVDSARLGIELRVWAHIKTSYDYLMSYKVGAIPACCQSLWQSSSKC